MTPSELKHATRETEPFFFTRNTMGFFGDTMRNYGCRAATVIDRRGETRAVWELYRKHAVKHGLKSSAYFDQETFERVFPNASAL